MRVSADLFARARSNAFTLVVCPRCDGPGAATASRVGVTLCETGPIVMAKPNRLIEYMMKIGTMHTTTTQKETEGT